MNSPKFVLCLLVLSFVVFPALAADKAKLTLDDYFNYVDFPKVSPSPDGRSVVVEVERADWEKNEFRSDLWLYRDSLSKGNLFQLTQSGNDSDPQWSPDGQWIAFLSERKSLRPKDRDGDDKEAGGDVAQVYVISPNGGEAIPVTEGDEEVHAFSWAADSQGLYFATRTPWTKDQKDAYTKEWKDVKQYRASERGDEIFAVKLTDAITRARLAGLNAKPDSDKDPNFTPGARSLGKTPWRVSDLVTAPNGTMLAFATTSISERQEKVGEFEVYVVNLEAASASSAPKQLTHNEAVEQHLRWANDNKHVFFEVDQGSVEGKYKDTQTRLYWVDVNGGDVQRWAQSFTGQIAGFAPTPRGVLFAGRLGTEVQLYSQATPSSPLTPVPGMPGTYEHVAMSEHSSRIAFIHSTLQNPAEVYVADDPMKVREARAITSFNQNLAEMDLPKGKPYRWTADDGSTVEGMLVYPPGKFESKNLPMFVFIHGGPADADGNHFAADWYQWDKLAATQGWLVFEPNYRGSTGYGDKFLMQIVPQIVSRPGKDILEGVDALVKDGIADPAHMAIGGYSYGGYMTNWLITQTNRFKAAVTGAGAVEHVANWGNDDMTFDDAYFLGGLPWEVPQRYEEEAAIFQMNKVRTPTHQVAGADDIRVAVAENYLLDHALHNLGVPSALLIFPGEGHSLAKNPWHGKIKVREELKWLQKYGEITPAP